MNLDLSGRTAVVTGGASGIGAASARELASLGASVMVADRDHQRAKAVARLLGGDAVAVDVDVTDAEAVRQMVFGAVDRFGSLDVAVNSAGVGMPRKAPIGSTAIDEWDRVLGVNLRGVFLSMRAELSVMRTGAAIVNIGSVMGEVAAPGSSPYVAAKHGLAGLTRTAALDYAASGIRINVVAPGFIDTPLLGQRDPSYLAGVAAAHPMGRLGLPEEISSVVAFLASPAASFITGAVVPVDGGYLAR